MKLNNPTIHLISHTHWDREWYLTFQQFRLKLVRMVDHVLNLFAHDPDFKHFMLDGQTIVLDDYLEMRPDQEARLKELVSQGKILIGPWYILPDEFLVSPESIIRNLIEGDRMARRFGPKMMVGYVPDPFGHIGQLPQILRGFGIDSACVQRGLDVQPVEFNWQAPDGSTVLMGYLREGYGNAAGLPTGDPVQFNSEVNRLKEALAGHSTIHGEHVLLMHGTDHTLPPADTTQAIRLFNENSDTGCLVHSTLPAYIESARKALDAGKLETITGELRSSRRFHLLPGVLSARAWIKQRNYSCQNLLEKYAEPLCAWAVFLGSKSEGTLEPRPVVHKPQPVLRAAWRLLLQNHPHDSICGCSIDQVHEEMRPRFDQVEQLGEELVNQGLNILVEAIDTQSPLSDPAAASAVVVYNPASCPASGLVEAAVEIPAGRKAFEVIDDAGQPQPLLAGSADSRDLINIILDPKGLKESFGMISAGRINGMVVCGIDAVSDGEQCHIELLLADSGEPNLDDWNSVVEKVEAMLAAGVVKQFIVRARSAPSATITMLAKDVPGCGYRTYWVREKADTGESAPLQPAWWVKAALPLASRAARLINRPGSSPAVTHRQPSKPPYRIENESLVVEANPKNGTLTVIDKRSGTHYSGLNCFVDGGDCGDEYNFSPPPVDETVTGEFVRAVYVSNDDVRSSIEIEMSLDLPARLAPDRKSRSSKRAEMHLTTTITLTSGVPRLDIRTWVHNHEIEDHRLRVHFPAPFSVNTAEMDGHFELVRRPIALPSFDNTWAEAPRPEKPQRAFTRISDGVNGLLIANRGLPEVEAYQQSDGQTGLALTLLRCVGWLSRDDFSTRRGHAGPMLATPGAQNPGEHIFEYSIIPYSQEDVQAALNLAETYESPLRAVPTTAHPGRLPSATSLIAVSPEAFVLTAVKPAEEGRGIIVRGYNRSSEAVQTRFTTLLTFKHAARVNLLEETIEEVGIEPDGSIKLDLRPFEIATIRLV